MTSVDRLKGAEVLRQVLEKQKMPSTLWILHAAKSISYSALIVELKKAFLVAVLIVIDIK